jgi:hypothetical protein
MPPAWKHVFNTWACGGHFVFKLQQTFNFTITYSFLMLFFSSMYLLVSDLYHYIFKHFFQSRFTEEKFPKFLFVWGNLYVSFTLKDNFTGCRILEWWDFFSSTLNISLHSFLIYMVPEEKCQVTLNIDPLYIGYSSNPQLFLKFSFCLLLSAIWIWDA